MSSSRQCTIPDCKQGAFKANYCVDHYRVYGAGAGSKTNPPASGATSKYYEQFKTLVASPIADQLEHFLKSFIFDLADDWKGVVQLEKYWHKRLKDANEGKDDLNPVMAADFLQKHGVERTASERKAEVADIDIDANDRIAFTEYLLLHYKVLILQAYFKRTGQTNPYDLSRGGIGVTGVGPQLLEELFTMPLGLDPALERAIEEFMQKKRAREAKVKELESKSAEGGVKGLAAGNELKQLESQDRTEMNRLEVTLEAAKKRSARDSAEVAFRKKKQAEETEAKEKADLSRQNLKNKASMWEQKK